MIGFGEYGMAYLSKATITTVTDSRLVRIDPQEKKFFDAVLNFTNNLEYREAIQLFIEAIQEVKEANIAAFYKPIYDPSEGTNKTSPVIYVNNGKPAIGHSYKWWVKTALKMPTIEGRVWKVATEYQYYAYLVYVINHLIEAGNVDIYNALKKIIINSSTLGHYAVGRPNSVFLCQTGSTGVCGMYDLANVHKFIRCSIKNTGGFWLAGGSYRDAGTYEPLACLQYYDKVNKDDKEVFNSVGMLVL